MYTYLALGDSYTIGEQVEAAQNFPHQTVALLNKEHIAVAAPVIIAKTGWTTPELQIAIAEQNILETFSFVTLLIGVNNQYRGQNVQDYQEDFAALLQQSILFANGHSRHVFVLSIPDWGVTPFAEGRNRETIAQEIDAYNAAAREITLANRCKWIDITKSTRENGQYAEFLAGDGLHPSGKEYSIWAVKLAAEVGKVLG